MTTLDHTLTGAAPADLVGALRDHRPCLLLHDVRLDRTGPAEPRHPAATEPLVRHLHRLGPRPRGTADLVDDLEGAGLTGHGGAHVPTAAKWRAALRSRGPLTVAANGAESEPLSAKDAALVQQRPHLVLDGLALAAEALGAHRAVMWLHADDELTVQAVRTALAERAASRRIEPLIEIASRPGHYLAGESSAIARALNGGPALPEARRRHDGAARPRTLVHNVETLARAALIARGHPPLRTRLLTVLTALHRQVLEVDEGTPAGDIFARTGWLTSDAPQAVLLGGFGGMWAPWSAVIDGTLDEPALRAAGLTAGAGIVAPLARDACGIAQTAQIAGYLAGMSAHQCGPCLFGLPALARSMRLLADGHPPRGERARLLADLEAVSGRGACHHPDGAVRLIASALTTFASDVAEHLHGRPCVASQRFPFPVPGFA